MTAFKRAKVVGPPTDSQRLARIESKLTQLMKWQGMPTDGRKPIVDRPIKPDSKGEPQ